MRSDLPAGHFRNGIRVKCYFLVSGARWKNRRRLLTPAFHFQILNSFVDVFNEKSLECAKELERIIDSQNGSEFDIFPIITECALDIICGNIFFNVLKELLFHFLSIF